ncbi:hypothetical protein M0R45_001863 [Rubus argutus]|uniref:Uncharacterized protein n=1 Tax=Rubus argutus TaxID=59490 RepID=A0AAW1VKA6_RUBAR
MGGLSDGVADLDNQRCGGFGIEDGAAMITVEARVGMAEMVEGYGFVTENGGGDAAWMGQRSRIGADGLGAC